MKKLITLLLVIITSLGYSQISEFEPFKPYRGEYNYIDWPMNSQIWTIRASGRYITDKNDDRYGSEIFIKELAEGRKVILKDLKNSYAKENTDEEKVKSYLYESFNEFRKDYELYPVKENKKLTKRAQEYSKQLTKKYKHSNSQGKYAECIAYFHRSMLHAITEGENVNKIIAECCFDTFVGSFSHMKILLKEDKRYEYGFGVTITDTKIFVVIQAQKTP
jgi:uncharacterized protein YkwD